MRRLVGGVSVITAGLGADRTGATVTTAQSLAVDPETMMVNINLGSSTWPAIRRYGHFCVNILADRHEDVAARFAGFGGIKGTARYEGARWTTLATGASALADALASIDCEVEHVIERHSHAIILGTVRAVRVGEGHALVYADGAFGRFAFRDRS
jgi:flavin reductase (DIM6/NTAB) family NADH-FMN oxidoreductase RutF